MNSMKKLVIMVLLAAAVGAVFAVKQMQLRSSTVPVKPAAVEPAKLPRLVDLGSDKCVLCKKMAPILDELKATQADRLEVEFIDVRKDPDAGRPHGVLVIPTQIFYAADGRELFRHEGFFSKEDIVAKWKEFGVELSAGEPQ
jgi:thioredoxin 1